MKEKITKHANISIFIPHNGCPCSCSFCNQRSITGQKSQPTPEEVRQEIFAAGEYMSARGRRRLGSTYEIDTTAYAGKINANVSVNNRSNTTTQIAFFGGSFTAIDREYMLSLLKVADECVKKYNFDGIRISTRPDKIGREILEILKTYGVKAIELGAQSMCDDVLLANDRGHTAEDVEKAARLIKDFGFELGLQMMTGLYKDTDEKAAETAQKLILLKPKTARIYPTAVLKGTKLEELFLSGEYKPQNVEQAVKLCADLLVKFEQADIEVIRVGLHAQDEIGSEVIAGAYHPAFKELCMSRVFLGNLLKVLSKSDFGRYTIKVNQKSLSVANGQKKENVEKLSQLGYEVKFQADNGIDLGRFKVLN